MERRVVQDNQYRAKLIDRKDPTQSERVALNFELKRTRNLFLKSLQSRTPRDPTSQYLMIMMVEGFVSSLMVKFQGLKMNSQIVHILQKIPN